MKKKSLKSVLKALLIAVALSGMSGCAISLSPGKPDYEGMVLDAETGKPVEGVFVLAEYIEAMKSSEWFGHSATHCVRTAGAYTDKKGRFKVPAARRHSPRIWPISVDYYYTGRNSYEANVKWGTYRASPRRFYVTRYSPLARGRNTLIDCTGARGKDVDANIVYLLIGIQQRRTNGHGVTFFEQTIESLERRRSD